MHWQWLLPLCQDCNTEFTLVDDFIFLFYFNLTSQALAITAVALHTHNFAWMSQSKHGYSKNRWHVMSTSWWFLHKFWKSRLRTSTKSFCHVHEYVASSVMREKTRRQIPVPKGARVRSKIPMTSGVPNPTAKTVCYCLKFSLVLKACLPGLLGINGLSGTGKGGGVRVNHSFGFILLPL